MMTASVWWTIASVFLGFAAFTGAFVSFRMRWPVALTAVLGAIAFVCVTVVPLIVAVFVASTPA
ncbi:hypothetical protein ACUY3K_10430 [Corynebacterium uberis]|uniref:hypothetical protein n=1 Tax=Corynebacterium TaxID=1716 RepID=UPI001D0B3A2F|nr:MULTISPECIES: hypothetical protein [Corynebacterium]MCZ9310334.1 hypothetical protein [Corynebacterium sp. c6VSa_13]UDL73360.1 hypothetical protein LH391_09755 [Corynebacterium uberis]UDL75762.1 hypothetical protein LH393_11175 [Corynebacterium uberis]UDL77974.1 hypothetical protein LH394_11160 [Corynebacterium uberis]UDL80257.1 hypothetical protein LH392_00060 [Corynebacterium uberis]